MTATPVDLDARRRLRTELDTTFFVEAGAGTGKTHELVARIVALIGHGRVRIHQLVAITFTEAAAAELRGRVRQALLQAGRDRSEPQRRERCDRAAREIDQAAIQTIHAFAATLLRAFPIEARLPPGFAIWDEVQRDQAFEERFRRWLYDTVPAEPDLNTILRRVFGLGMKVADLRELALRLEEQHDLLQAGRRWISAPADEPVSVAHRLGNALIELAPMVDQARDPLMDQLVHEIRRMQPVATRLRGADSEQSALEALLEFERRPPKSIGKQADWFSPPKGEIHPVRRVKDTFRQVSEGVDEVLEQHRTAALGQLLGALSAFTLAGAEERRRAGVATFHDLLVWARDLLRDDAVVRRTAADRYRRILVDEFQDTDPLQAELICLLAADTSQANITDWRELRLAPGRLFIVGDPKQSIYRFRRADIAVYEALYARTDGESERVVLSQTRRSIEPLVSWVNAYFGVEMRRAPGVQAGYERLAARPPLPGVEFDDLLAGVSVIGGVVEGTAGERWEQEADAIARTSRHVVQRRWQVSARDGEHWQVRPARFSDVCVLLPGRTNLRRLERAFELHGVPYRMESGSLVLQTQEVRDLLSCMRAVDDPSDQVALVAALRSPAYGCSDVDLLAWVEDGGALSYERARPAIESPVAAAFDSLKAFHSERLDRSAAATIEAFIHERCLAVQALGAPRPREAWRRLRYVVAQARRKAESGDPTLRGLLDWLERLQRNDFYDTESALPEADEDAVRLLTVHGAKGLESPVVILSGLGAGLRPADSIQVVPDYLAGRLEVRCGKFRTPGWDGDRERQLNEAEALRLLYVAATRAREHLVLSLFRGASGACAAGRIEEVLDRQEVAWRRLTFEPEPVWAEHVTDGQVSGGDGFHEAVLEHEWSAERSAQLAQLGREHVATPSGLTEYEGGSGSVPSGTSQKAALALGLAVHAVLQRVELGDMSDLEQLARTIAEEYQVDALRIGTYTRRAAQSRPVRAALNSGRYWREVPVAAAIGDTVVEGTIDLLYEHADGTLGVVDYKTDRVPPGDVAQHAVHYELQGGAYAVAVGAATALHVSSVEFVFVALNEGNVIGYFGDAVERLAERAKQAARTRALSD
ncbi:MAG: UvrD-helicase domain-containing protein [Chloroflexi bacterium]|nr:UvrD-helicase domain-containing protein [Chloroflexota bacterium]